MQVFEFTHPLPQPIDVLETLLENAGSSIVQAAFRYSFFVNPNRVRERTPYFPDRARMSREHYPKGDRGDVRQWKEEPVHLGNNSRAHLAWEKYTGRPIARRSGYGVRHIWGYPWDPFAFTAGWNLCYMPFWLGMLTEDQHPHQGLVEAIKQASFDLFFRDGPVCELPEYVSDPGIDLVEILGEQRIQILASQDRKTTEAGASQLHPSTFSGDPAGQILAIRKARNASWANLLKAVASLQNRPHEPFGTDNVASTSKSIVRLMVRQTGLTLRELETAIRGVAQIN